MRRVVAWVLAVVGSWAIALGLIPIRAEVGLDAVLLCSLILVLVVAAIGGLWPALVTAILAFVADELFFTPPYDTLSIRPTPDRVAVIVFVVVGSALGTVVGILIDRLSGLANQQGALRRVATLVAQAAPSERIFGTATEEAGHLLRVDVAMLHHYESDGTLQVAASWDRTGRLGAGRNKCAPLRKGMSTRVVTRWVPRSGGSALWVFLLAIAELRPRGWRKVGGGDTHFGRRSSLGSDDCRIHQEAASAQRYTGPSCCLRRPGRNFHCKCREPSRSRGVPGESRGHSG